MKHTMGNSCKCSECFYFTFATAEEEQKCNGDGWCSNRNNLSGKHKDRRAVAWNDVCTWWEDGDTRITRFEIECRRAGEWRKPLDRESVLQEMDRAEAEQRAQREEWRRQIDKIREATK